MDGRERAHAWDFFPAPASYVPNNSIRSKHRAPGAHAPFNNIRSFSREIFGIRAHAKRAVAVRKVKVGRKSSEI